MADISIENICAPSSDVVAREIEGEILIIPLAAGIGDAGDELYTLNATGQAIWEKLDGRVTLGNVAAALTEEFNAPIEQIEKDVLGFAGELVRRGILVIKT